MERYSIIKKQYSYLVIDNINGRCLIDTESEEEAKRVKEYNTELSNYLFV